MGFLNPERFLRSPFGIFSKSKKRNPDIFLEAMFDGESSPEEKNLVRTLYDEALLDSELSKRKVLRILLRESFSLRRAASTFDRTSSVVSSISLEKEKQEVWNKIEAQIQHFKVEKEALSGNRIKDSYYRTFQSFIPAFTRHPVLSGASGLALASVFALMLLSESPSELQQRAATEEASLPIVAKASTSGVGTEDNIVGGARVVNVVHNQDDAMYRLPSPERFVDYASHLKRSREPRLAFDDSYSQQLLSPGALSGQNENDGALDENSDGLLYSGSAFSFPRGDGLGSPHIQFVSND
jgi:hypothetical protein